LFNQIILKIFLKENNDLHFYIGLDAQSSVLNSSLIKLKIAYSEM